MCLHSILESKIDIIIKKISPKVIIDILPSREIYIPICVRESSYLNSTNFSDKILKAELTEIPKTVIEKWFDNSNELVYDSIKDFLTGVDFIKFKSQIVDIIQRYIRESREEYHSNISKENLQKIRNVESLIWWSNAVSERIRQFI
jgi:hypothetical protein